MSEYFPTPKYKKGDKVYASERSYSNTQIECPDCLGTKLWIVVFADGEALEVQCQTCAGGYEPPSGFISYQTWKPNVSILTIGSVRFDDNGFSYMCVETGIGSGRVWDEDKLYSEKDDAQKDADIDHVEGMKQLARNNFSKKFKGSKAIEEMLSTFGWSRREMLLKKRKFIEWAKISDLITKRKENKS